MGYSGSPVMLADGTAVGVLRAADTDETTKIALAIPCSALNDPWGERHDRTLQSFSWSTICWKAENRA